MRRPWLPLLIDIDTQRPELVLPVYVLQSQRSRNFACNISNEGRCRLLYSYRDSAHINTCTPAPHLLQSVAAGDAKVDSGRHRRGLQVFWEVQLQVGVAHPVIWQPRLQSPQLLENVRPQLAVESSTGWQRRGDAPLHPVGGGAAVCRASLRSLV